MPDREKVEHVINAFERVIEVFDGRISGPYFEAWMCATKDALALLKAQEPVKPVFERQFMTSIEIYDCGKCGTSLGAKGIAKYCMKCGQAVKWK